ncbi:MAG: hypothetical protein Q8O72_00260 [Bacteroidales bacterium]|nr:hypothetical protein [Bacteroidales bacterium]
MTFYNQNGNAVAYIDDDNETIFLWDGTPVAYLDKENIYGFNGKHLGWFEDGIVWNHNGEKNGFTKKSLPVFSKFEPFKAFKKFKPFKSFKEFAPFKPFKSSALANLDCNSFLKLGEK